MQNQEAPLRTVWAQGPARPATIQQVYEGLRGRVRLVGLVLNKEEDRFILDDGTGSIRIVMEDLDLLNLIMPGTEVRVIGRVLASGDKENPEIVGELIQKMEKLDLTLYREVYELKKSLFEP